jgi:hypothetical protein
MKESANWQDGWPPDGRAWRSVAVTAEKILAALVEFWKFVQPFSGLFRRHIASVRYKIADQLSEPFAVRIIIPTQIEDWEDRGPVKPKSRTL